MIKKLSKNILHISFAVTGVILILWKLLLPGYVLTLDASFGPNFVISSDPNDILGRLPIFYALSFLTKVFGGWQTEKIFLIILFFLLFYLPLKYFKRIFTVDAKSHTEYAVSAIFAINPFVYERFMAGQWFVLFGYALFMPLTAYVVEFYAEPSYKKSLIIVLLMSLIAAVVPHLFVMSALCLGIVILLKIIKSRASISVLKKISVIAGGLGALNLYWLIPMIFSNDSRIAVFTAEHWEAFRTAGTGLYGTLGNVLILHGFWQEHEYWKWIFAIPKNNGYIFIFSISLLLGLVAAGLYSGLKERTYRDKSLLLLFILALAIIFSCGVGDGVFKQINFLIFEHVSFWSGFRDSQKWSAIIALIYALFAGLGIQKFVSFISSNRLRKIAIVLFTVIPLMVAPMLLFGIGGQLKNVDYPKVWYEANSILKAEPECKAVFLPWHQYYVLKFNDNLLTYNTSSNFFDCTIIYGKNLELGRIKNTGVENDQYYLVDDIIKDKSGDIDELIGKMKDIGIEYIIFTDDLIKQDPFKYEFLQSDRLIKIIDKDGIKLYKL